MKFLPFLLAALFCPSVLSAQLQTDTSTFRRQNKLYFGPLLHNKDPHMGLINPIPSDSSIQLDEAVVTGIQPSSPRATSLHIEPYSLQELQKESPYNLSDALARLPGISQMSTGNAISKPVIRGLYGNRILVLLSGLRFDNQQFQDEHGLGLSQIGIDRVEIIRGPASLLYGTDAIGGVINVIEETPHQPGRVLDINTRLYSNTLGTLTDVGLSAMKTNHTWWRIRGGYESNGDYADGAGARVYDSRNTGYYFKGGYGFQKKNWTSNNAYNFSFNQFGFILDSLNGRGTRDDRWSRSMENPHHNVMLNTFSSQNTFLLNKDAGEVTAGSVLNVNAGIQSNKRAEDEGGGEISLNMHLLSLLENAKWEKYLDRKTLIVINQQATYEINTNYGKRILIPDAHMLEGNLSAFLRRSGEKIIWEAGLGYTAKRITSLLTRPLNTPDKSIAPFSTTRPSFNGMIGFSYNPAARINLKGNISTGVRTGNLAELASDGLHEGSFRYEIGNPDLKPEQNINGDITLEMSRKHWSLSLSGFYNHFNNYIYLTPTTDTFKGLFQIFRYVQQDADLYGGEMIAVCKPVKWCSINETFSVTEGVTADGQNLPFIPAWRSLTSIRVENEGGARWKDLYLEPELEYVLPQNHPSVFETGSADYALLHLHTGITVPVRHHAFDCRLSVRNLLNKTYADHLSRLRYYGINNQGINVVLSVGTHIGL